MQLMRRKRAPSPARNLCGIEYAPPLEIARARYSPARGILSGAERKRKAAENGGKADKG